MLTGTGVQVNITQGQVNSIGGLVLAEYTHGDHSFNLAANLDYDPVTNSIRSLDASLSMGEDEAFCVPHGDKAGQYD